MIEQGERGFVEGLAFYAAILRKKAALIILITLIPTLLAVGFAVATRKLPVSVNPYPDVYTAKATILTQRQPGGDFANSILSALGVDQRTFGSSTGYDVGSLVLQVLNSRTLLDRVIEEFRLAQRYRITANVKGATRSRLLQKLKTDYSRAAGVITISLEDTDPAFARDVVNRMLALLQDWFNQNSGSAKKRQILMLEEKVNEVKADIADLEDNLKALQKKYGVLNAGELGASQATALADLRSQLILKEIEIKNYTSFSIVDDPKLQQLKEEQKNLADLIGRFEKGLPEDFQAGSDTPSMQTLPDVAQKFSQLTLELEIQKRIYNTLSPQYQAAKLTADNEPLFQILEYAEAPDIKSGPQRSRIVIIAAAASLLAGVIIALLANAFSELKKSQYKTNP